MSKAGRETFLIASRIRILRESEGWLIEELAERLNVKPTYVRQMEQGHKPMSINMAKLYRSIFNVTLDYIYFGGNN